MDMKSMIARMDAIESKKILKEDAAPPMELDSQVDEFIKGTAPEKIAAWMKHIKDFKDKGMYKAADDATQAMKKVHPDYKKHSAPTPEFRGGIAQALMQDMGMDDQEVEEDGETQMPDIPRVPMTSSDGQVVTSSDGQPVMSGGPTQQGGGGAAPIVNRDINKPDALGVSPTPGSDADATLYDFSQIGADNNPAGPQGTTPGPAPTPGPAQGPAGAPPVDPAKIQRFQELLKKAQGGGGAAAPKPSPGKKPGGGAQKGQANPIAAGYTQAQKNVVPSAGGVTESDDQILAMIRAIK